MSFAIVYQLLVLHALLTVPHELGHLVVARLIGVAVPEFGIGLPPTLIARRWRGTRWRINLLPLGAFVAYETSESRRPARRAAIAIAGPAANLLVALLCLVLIPLTETANPAVLVVKASQHVGSGLPAYLVNELLPLIRLTTPVLGAFVRPWTGPGEFLRLVLTASVAVGLFNLLPMPPLDGSKLLSIGLRVLGCGPSFERWVGRLSLAVLSILACAGVAVILTAGLK